MKISLLVEKIAKALWLSNLTWKEVITAVLFFIFAIALVFVSSIFR